MKRIGLAILLVSTSFLFGASSQTAGAATNSYPNLMTVKPSDLHFDVVTIDGTSRAVLRFSNAVWNGGQGHLELRAKTVGTGSAKKTRVQQRIFDDMGGYITKNVGDFVFHPSHDHFHFEDFAEYELWKQTEYEAWLRGGNGLAQRRGSKTTFCIMDTYQVQTTEGSQRPAAYTTCNQSLQGLSVAWADLYGYALPEQWIDLGTAFLADGSYVLRSIADPRNRLYESPQKGDASRESQTANAAITFFDVKAGEIMVTG